MFTSIIIIKELLRIKMAVSNENIKVSQTLIWWQTWKQQYNAASQKEFLVTSIL